MCCLMVCTKCHSDCYDLRKETSSNGGIETNYFCLTNAPCHMKWVHENQWLACTADQVRVCLNWDRDEMYTYLRFLGVSKEGWRTLQSQLQSSFLPWGWCCSTISTPCSPTRGGCGWRKLHPQSRCIVWCCWWHCGCGCVWFTLGRGPTLLCLSTSWQLQVWRCYTTGMEFGFPGKLLKAGSNAQQRHTSRDCSHCVCTIVTS